MLAQTNASYQAAFVLKKIDNSPYDLTGAIIRMQFKSAAGTVAALTATTQDMLSIGDDPTLGRLSLNVPTAAMKTVPPGTYFFDALKQIDPENYLMFRGKWTVLPGITDDPSLTLPPLPGRLHCTDAITIIMAASELQVSVDGAAPPLVGGIPNYVGVPDPHPTQAQIVLDTSDGNMIKVIFPTSMGGLVRDVFGSTPDPTA